METARLLQLLDSFHRARVLVLGDVMLDSFVHGYVDRISPEAPIPVLSVIRTVDMPGGAANVARNVAALGARVVLIGIVGEDAAATALKSQLSGVPSIDSRLITDTSRPTTLKTRHVADRQQILRTDVESRAPLSQEAKALLLSEYRSAVGTIDVVVLSDYAKGLLSDDVAQSVISTALSANVPVLVDPKSKSFSKYKGATVLTPNQHELELACGAACSTDEQIVAGARAILGEGICSALVATRGKGGMSVVREEGPVTHLRTMAREVYDVSGAGDTAIAVLSLGIASDASIEEAAKLANLAAGIVVGKYGTATVTTGEIIATFEQIDRNLESESRKNFTLESVLQLVDWWRERGLRIAFTNGCFDLLHPGHVSLLEQARTAADRLVVGLNSDLSVRRLKGASRPAQSEVARATVLASLKSVDAVVIFSEDTPLKLIETLEPDVLVKGADYTVDQVVGADLTIKRGGRVLLADLVPEHSTTRTLRNITRATKP